MYPPALLQLQGRCQKVKGVAQQWGTEVTYDEKQRHQVGTPTINRKKSSGEYSGQKQLVSGDIKAYILQ